MEYLGGGSCQDLLKPGSFNEGHVAIICRELLLGLDYLHREGKIHRDVKAANVLLANSGKVKLADFGVAAQMTNIKSVRNTFVGTPFWMAPEVIQEAGYDYRADIWSLGITALELINGEPPHSNIHPMKVLFLIPKSDAPRLEGRHYSQHFKDFIAACLVKNPDYRPSAKELLRHRFIRNAGKIEGLQELIQRRQMYDADTGRVVHPKYYEEALTVIAPLDENEGWDFDTVKAANGQTPRVTTMRRATEMSIVCEENVSTEVMMSNLSLDENSAQPVAQPPQQPSTVHASPSRPSIPTMRRLSTKRRASGPQPSSPSKTRKPSGQRQPLATDMSFGNSASSVRQFARVPDNSPVMTPDGTLGYADENTNPSLDSVTKEALVGRQAYAKVIDGVFQEVHAQTANHARREAIAHAHQAWNSLDLNDPEGEFQILKLLVERLQQYVDTSKDRYNGADTSRNPKLASLLPPSQPTTPQKPKLVLAQNNPHLKSHRRRQSAIITSTNNAPSADPWADKTHLPGQVVPGMEHTQHLADVLYGKWVESLRSRWPVMS
jgi:serine/threonine-protein kinase 24/25/MST4